MRTVYFCKIALIFVFRYFFFQKTEKHVFPTNILKKKKIPLPALPGSSPVLRGLPRFFPGSSPVLLRMVIDFCFFCTICACLTFFMFFGFVFENLLNLCKSKCFNIFLIFLAFWRPTLDFHQNCNHGASTLSQSQHIEPKTLGFDGASTLSQSLQPFARRVGVPQRSCLGDRADGDGHLA